MKVVEILDVEVEYNKKRKRLPVTIVQGNGPTLLGKSWLQSLQLDWDHLCISEIGRYLSK